MTSYRRCAKRIWNTAATNKCDDGKGNDVVENGGTLSSEKPVLAIICRPEQQRDNFACEIERVTPHFLEISKEILSSLRNLWSTENRPRDTKTSSPLTSNSEVKPSSARTVRYSPAFSSAKNAHQTFRHFSRRSRRAQFEDNKLRNRRERSRRSKLSNRKLRRWRSRLCR